MDPDGANLMSEGAEPRAVGAAIQGRYRVLEVVGRGGLGVVYKVADLYYPNSPHVYALKELADPAPGARKQFATEASFLRSLDHERIPKVHDTFEWDDRIYLVMDFIEGENLEQLLRRTGRALPEAQALQWMLPVCEALQYLHTLQPPLLHRDVKPANIIITPDGRPVLVDFGIAKAHLPGMNQTNTFVRKAGTEGYAPPEQYAANGLTGPWSDVYAVGATLYQLLTRQLPDTAVDRIVNATPMASPRQLNPAISPRTDATIMRAMELKPTSRYRTMLEMAAQLLEAHRALSMVSGPLGAAPASGPLSGHSGPVSSSAPGVHGPGVERPRTPASLPPHPATGGLGSVGSGFSGPSGPSNPFSSSYPAIGGGGSGPYQPIPRGGSPATPISTPSSRLPELGAPLPSNLGGGRVSGEARGPVTAHGLSNPSGVMPTHRVAVSAPSREPASRPATSAPRLRERPQDGERSRGADGGKRSIPLPVWIVGLIVLLAVVAFGAVYGYRSFAPPDRSTPQNTISGYFTALEHGNYAQAWEFSSASRNAAGTQGSFSASLSSDDARYGRPVSFQIQAPQFDNAGHATATVIVKRANAPNSPLTYTVQLTQYDGSTWLIDSVSN